MSLRLNTLVVAVAAILSPLAAQANGHDGFQLVGDTLIYVGNANAAPKSRADVKAELVTHRQADSWQVIGDTLVFAGHDKSAGKSRAEVRAELAAWIANPVSHDGFAEIGGESLRFVGKPTAADVKLAERHFNAR